jgi:hypothetical protein
MSDPNPVAAWREYLAAAQSLDAVRREAASTAVAATRTVSTARAELAQVRSDLRRQRVALEGRAAGSGRRRVRLAASEAEQVAAADLAAGDPATVRSALRDCQGLLRAADADIAGHGSAGRPSGWRRWFAAGVIVAGLAAVVAVLLPVALG